MTDLPTPDPAVQLCTGPDGHIPPEAHRAEYGNFGAITTFSAPVPGFPDIVVVAQAATVGQPCLGLGSTVTHDWGVTGPGPHLASFAVGFDPPRPEAPLAYVAGTRSGPNEITRLGHNGDNLSRADRQRLVDAYQVVINGSGGPLRPGGRRAGQRTGLSPEQVTEITAYVKQRLAANDRWENIIAELKRGYPEDTHEHKWNERTLRRWVRR